MNKITDPFENLLRQLDEVNGNVKRKKDVPLKPGMAVDLFTADGAASIHDFFRMVGLIVEHAMDDIKAEFAPDDNKYYFFPDDNNDPLNHPMVIYKVIKRVPKSELKPTVREYTIQKDEDGNDRKGVVYGQRFEYSVQFDIYANNTVEVDKAMDRFEELMIAYAGHIKGQGVVEYYLKEQFIDSYFMNFRETICMRSLVYYVEIEKLSVIFNEKIKDIASLGDIKKEYK